MSNQFQFDLVSPEKTVISKPAVMVTIPGGEGDFGVLAGHSPLITSVKPGVIDIYGLDDQTISERVFVAGGFAEVTGERCTILAEEALLVTELDRSALDEEMRRLNMESSDNKSDAESAMIEQKLSVVRAKLQALSN